MTETLKQIFHRMSIVFSNQLAILITIPYITFTLGIEEYGIVAAGIILVQICWVLCDWGFGYHSIEFFSKNKSTKLRNQYFSSVFIIKIIIICFFSLFVYLLAQSKLILVTNQYLLLSLFLPFLTGGLNPLNFLQAIKKPKYLVKPTFFSRILYLILIFSLVKNFESSYWVFVAQGITMFFISFYGYLVLFKMYNFKLVLPNVFFLKKQFFEATPFFLNGIITINFSSFWGFGLSLLAGPFQIAIYSLADLVLRSANTLSTVVPHTIRANYIDEPLQKIKRIIFSFTLFYLVLMIIGILVIPIFIKIFFDSSFYASIYVIQIMLIVWFIGSINKLLGFPVFSKIYDSKRLNQLVYLFGMLHLSAFGIWASFSSYQADQLVLYLLFISVLECIIFALFILMKYLKKPNSKAIKMKFLFDFYTQTDLMILVLFFIVLTASLILNWKKISFRFNAIEYDSVQRIHKDKTDVPRMGGLILFVGLVCCLFINVDIDPWLNKELKPIFLLLLLCNIPLFLVALREDIKYDVSPSLRLIAILLSSSIFILTQPYGLPTIDIPYIGHFLNIPIVGILFFTIAHAGYCNGMNLIDGSNGLAGMVVFTTLLSIGFVSFMLSDLVILYIVLIFLSFIGIFLIFNYPWGSIFLGDSGAYLWGSLLASLTIILYSRHDVPTWGAVVILFYPSIEMVFSYIRKKYQKRNPLHPDPDHMHLKLYFVIERSVSRARVANCLVMPMISIIWLTPAMIIPWVFSDGILSMLSIIFLSILYFGFYWALPTKNKIKA